MLGQRVVPKVAGGTWGGWRPRKGEKRTSQLILTNLVVWMNQAQDFYFKDLDVSLENATF